VIPESKISEIRERADIAEVIGDFVTLKRAGANLKGVCPFHADTDPSFNVNPGRQFFHCFGCGASGDVFTFLQRIEGLQFTDALERLAGRYGVELPVQPMAPAARSAQERAREAARRRREILEEAALFFETQLKSPAGQAARQLLADRGIDEQTAETFRLGFAPDSWQALLDHLGSKRIAPREIERVGLALPRKSGSGYYDRFRNRLVFTVTDASGHPIAFSGRALDGGGAESGAKYINSPETEEYTKGKVLYGLHQARVHVSKTQEAVLVEGNFDVVSLAHAGVGNVVAPLGTALTEDQAAILRRRVERVVVMFDGDSAGRKASARAFPVLARAGLAAYVAPLPEGEDPDSLVRRGGLEAVQELLARKRGLLDEIIDASAAASDGTAQDVARRIEKLGRFVGSVISPMERDLYRQRVADAFAVEPRTVFRYMRDGSAREERGQEQRESAGPPGSGEERELMGILLDQPQLFDEAQRTGLLTMIANPALKSIAEELALRHRRKDSLIADMMVGASDNPAVSWLAERAMTCLYRDEEQAKKALTEIGERLARAALNDQIREIEQQIKLANSSGDETLILELQRKKTEIQRELHGVEQGL
jgi:DNA primase